ncbi:MAG: tetratricopeptide repeat protein [Alphaproteobacteria bacterium]|nr:tetratricopeptide repeat protein [Alphaproteobacteria bacterium]MBT5859607.1 tetratricopeptide repeat protein [Alphaproteobacteria bacterium]
MLNAFRSITRGMVTAGFALALIATSPVVAQEVDPQATEWERHSQLGTAAFGANDLTTAEPHFRSALEIAEAIFAPDDPRSISSLVNLSQWQKAVGNPLEALALMERALRIQESVLDPRHDDLMGTLALLAALHAQLEQLDEAAAVYTRVLDLRRNRIGDYHPQTLGTIAELAPVLEAIGDSEGAELLYQEAILSWSELLGVHGRVADAIDKYGEFLRRQGREDEAAQADNAAAEVRVLIQVILDGGG